MGCQEVDRERKENKAEKELLQYMRRPASLRALQVYCVILYCKLKQIFSEKLFSIACV